MNSIIIREGKEKPIRLHHPWIFANAIAKINGKPNKGEVVEVKDSNGNFLARGFYNPFSQICLRLLEWNESVLIDNEWFIQKLTASIDRRKNIFKFYKTNAVRLVNAESDMIPGLIVDQYNEFLAVQFLTAGIDRLKLDICEILKTIIHPKGIYERSDADVRKLENLPATKGILLGEKPPEEIEIIENGYRFIVNIKEGQKTGFFLDQRENRNILSYYAWEKDVLDCFCYTGGFSIYSLKSGAKSVESIDSSSKALNILKKNIQGNKLQNLNYKLIEGDVFQILRNYRDDERKFDMVILDPPKLAPAKQFLNKAMRAYKDINLLAMKVLSPGGILATFSCSGGVSLEDFKKVIGWASIDAKKEVQIIRTLSQAEDHPIRISYPESEYLKGLICRVV